MSLWDQVIEDMKKREVMGHRKYGKNLEIDDKRDMLVEAFEECLDQCIYLKAAIVKRSSYVVSEQRSGEPGQINQYQGHVQMQPKAGGDHLQPGR